MKSENKIHVALVAAVVMMLSPVVSAQDTEENNTDSEKTVDGDESEVSEDKPQGPGLFDVDEDAATRALERSLIQLDALLLGKGKAELGFDVGYSFNASSTPVLIELIENDTGGESTAVATTVNESRDYSLIADFRFGLPGDTQLDVSIPLEVSTQTAATSFVGGLLGRASSTESGVGDISLSLLKTVSHEKGRRPDVIARLTYNSDSLSGDENTSIGSGAQELTVGLSATKRQDPLVFTYGLSHTISIEDDGFKAGPVTQLSLGTVLAASPYTSLRLAFDQIIVSDSEFDGQSIEGSGANIGALTFGVSSVISQFTFLSAGIRFSLTDVGTDYSLTMGFSRRFDLSR